MRAIATDGVAWSVSASVCLCVTRVSPTKTAELIEMPFGGVTSVGPRNHVLNGGHGRANSFAAVKGDNITMHAAFRQNYYPRRLL